MSKEKVNRSKGVDYVEQKYGVSPKDLTPDSDGLYSIYDKCQKIFLPPFPSPTLEACRRSIIDIVAGQPTSLMAKYPYDYELYRLAYWDNKTGYISIDVPVRLNSIYELLALHRKDKDNETTV